MDERPQQLLIDAHEPLPMEAGQPEREDDAYERNGVSDIFLFFEPRFEFHYTPKPGSWLTTAEIELSALVRSCLNRRILDQVTLLREAQAWADERNPKAIGVDGRFTTADARITLKRLYPKTQD